MKKLSSRHPSHSLTPAAPRLRAATALPRLEAAVLENDGVHSDVQIVGTLEGRRLTKLVLERVELRDVNLTHTRFDKLRMLDVRLRNCDLANAVWRDSSIDRVEFVGCRMTGLDLTEMAGSDVIFRECSGPLACLRFAVMQRTLFENCQLRELDLQNATVRNASARGCDLTAAMFFGAQFAGTDLCGCVLDDVRFRSPDLSGVTIDPTQLITIAPTLASVAGILVRRLEDQAT